MVSTAVWESQLLHLLERSQEQGIKKRLGAFRPDFPVTAGQQVSLIRYAQMQGRSVQLGGSRLLCLLGADTVGGNQEVAGCF
jgi:hypothetical protein